MRLQNALLVLLLVELCSSLPLLGLLRFGRYARLGGRSAVRGGGLRAVGRTFKTMKNRYLNFRKLNPNYRRMIDLATTIGGTVGLTAIGAVVDKAIRGKMSAEGVRNQTFVNATIDEAKAAIQKIADNSVKEAKQSDDASMYEILHKFIGNDSILPSTAKLQADESYIPNYDFDPPSKGISSQKGELDFLDYDPGRLDPPELVNELQVVSDRDLSLIQKRHRKMERLLILGIVVTAILMTFLYVCVCALLCKRGRVRYREQDQRVCDHVHRRKRRGVSDTHSGFENVDLRY